MKANEEPMTLDPILENELPPDAANLIKSEGYHLTREIADLKVSNREQYEIAIQKGIANANILKRLEDLQKALLMPYKADIKKIDEAFTKAKALFEVNDEKIRKALVGYASRVDVSNIKTIHTELGSATIQERQDFEILDEKQVPREFLKVDETKVRRAVTAGLLEDSAWIKLKINLTPAFKAA